VPYVETKSASGPEVADTVKLTQPRSGCNHPAFLM
jgi:hypothetical protein